MASSMVMHRIHAAGNAYNPCLIVLQSKGYLLWAETEGDMTVWCAKRRDWTFSGLTPPELLGIVVLGETLGEGWNQQTPDLVNAIPDREVGEGEGGQSNE